MPGHCFQYAVKQAMLDKSVTVVHGFITQPCSVPPERNAHAWVEKNGIVRDWQTMTVPHYGGQFAGKGYPVALFNELFKPEPKVVYTAQQVIDNHKRHRHCGPWS